MLMLDITQAIAVEAHQATQVAQVVQVIQAGVALAIVQGQVVHQVTALM